MRKLEQKFQTAFNLWLKHRWDEGPAAFELKRTTLRSLPLTAIKDHQIAALMQVSMARHIYKIPDDAYAQKPYDSYVLSGEGYVVIAYGERLTGCYMIRAHQIASMKEQGLRSITEEQAKTLGRRVDFK